MDLLQAALFPAFVLVLAGVMVYSHAVAWKKLKAGDEQLDAEDREFRVRQCRRRLQASSLLGLVGVALFIGQLIDFRRNPSFFVFYWCAVALLVVWILLLALLDVFATRMRNVRLQQERLIETAKLQARLRALKDRGADGAAEKLRLTPPTQSAHHAPGRNGEGR